MSKDHEERRICLFHSVSEYTQSIHDRRKMWVLPNQLLYWVVFPHWIIIFVSFQPIWCHPHTQIRITLFHGVRICIHNWKPSPNLISIGFLSNYFSHNSPAQGWPYRFRSGGTTGSSIYLKSEKHFQEQKQLDPIIPEQANHLISVQCPKRWSQILLNCGETAVCFLHIQLIGTNVWLPKTHNVPLEVDFESSRSPREVRVLKQSQSALFSSIFHMTILFVFTWVMKKWNQSIQAFVTGFSPFCDGTCELVYWP